MKISIFSGGTGSEQLQIGLWKLFGDHIQTTIIINGYDDGKSTGLVRRICNDDILGPSDLRKNQLLRHKLRNGETPLYNFLNHRFTSDTPKDYLKSFYESFSFIESTSFIIKMCIEEWFTLPLSNSYSYHDFNIGNIIYAYLFLKKGVEETIVLMNQILSIPDEVMFHSNHVLRLKAMTQSGLILHTEDSIISYCDEIDKIEDVFLINKHDHVIQPVMEEKVLSRLKESDLILFSCGTQWSSLIPTYKAYDFYNIIKHIKCPKYIVMNLFNDNDMKGCDTSDYISIWENYFDMKDIIILFVSESNLQPSSLNLYNYCIFNKCVNNKVHDGEAFFIQLFMHYFRLKTSFTGFIVDIDYTILDPNQPELSERLKQLVSHIPHKTVLLSANHYKNIPNFGIETYSNNGCLRYDDHSELKKGVHLTDLDKEYINKIIAPYKDKCNIEDRGVSISLKPVTQDIILELKCHFDTKYKVIASGKTTVEIMYPFVSKRIGYEHIKNNYPHESFLYLSDMDDIEGHLDKWIISSMSEVLVFFTILLRRKPYMPNLIIISGGVNSRMGISTPKLLMETQHGTRTIDYIYRYMSPFVSSIYIGTNKIHYPLFTDLFYVPISCDMPRGSLETLSKSMVQDVNERFIVIWGDCLIKDSKLVAELTSCYHNITVPCNYEKNPYAYVIHTKDNIIDHFMFKKTNPIDYGFHDLSMFYLEKNKIKNEMNELLSVQKESEYHLFDLFPILKERHKPALFYESKHQTYSYNTIDEFNAIIIDL